MVKHAVAYGSNETRRVQDMTLLSSDSKRQTRKQSQHARRSEDEVMNIEQQDWRLHPPPSPEIAETAPLFLTSNSPGLQASSVYMVTLGYATQSSFHNIAVSSRTVREGPALECTQCHARAS